MHLVRNFPPLRRMQGGILWVCAHYIHPCMWANANVINIPNSGFFENGDVGVIFPFIRVRTPRKVREMVLRLREKENLGGGGGGGENITLTSRQLNVGEAWEKLGFLLFCPTYGMVQKNFPPTSVPLKSRQLFLFLFARVRFFLSYPFSPQGSKKNPPRKKSVNATGWEFNIRPLLTLLPRKLRQGGKIGSKGSFSH